MAKFFTTEGPVRVDEHYQIPPLVRWDLEEILSLIEQKKYFILHSPRQTGKTSALLALRDKLNRGGAEEIHLMICDQRGGKTWEEKISRNEESYQGKTVVVWGV